MVKKFPNTKIEVLSRLLNDLSKDMWENNLLTYRERTISNKEDVGMGKLNQIEYKITGFILSNREMEVATQSLQMLKSFAPPKLQKDVDKLINIFNVEE